MSGVKNDRDDYKEKNKDRVYKDSVGNDLSFGANVVAAKDVLPLQQQGGG